MRVKTENDGTGGAIWQIYLLGHSGCVTRESHYLYSGKSSHEITTKDSTSSG